MNVQRVSVLVFASVLILGSTVLNSAFAADALPKVQPQGLVNSEADNPEADTSAADALPKVQPQGPVNPEADNPEAEPTGLGDLRKGDRAVTLAVDCDGQGGCREKLTGEPFRVLPRSFSNVYRDKTTATDNIAVENVRAFYPVYVFAREEIDFSAPADPKGWYQVSESEQGPPIGWMQARDVLEWKQALLVSYTHPGTGDDERRRVLMFRTLEDLKKLVESEVREQFAGLLYQNVAQERIPHGVVSKEPERFVDISRTFYLLPIIDYETVDINGDEARYLHLAAAVPQRRGADTLEDPDYREQAKDEGKLEGKAARELGVDLVFVMDMTRSMQPYIDQTKQALADLARTVASKEVKQKVRFGLVGYRDDVTRFPALEFTSRNFTPELVDVDTFVTILEKEAKATSFGSKDYPEEVFAGVQTGLASAWDEGSLRILCLVGDASSHEVDHPQNTTGKDAKVLRLAAKDAHVHLLALHLLYARMPTDHELAKTQFTTLSKIEGSEESALVQIDTADKGKFTEAVQKSTRVIFDLIKQVQSGDVASLGQSGATTGEEDVGAEAEDKMRRLMASALIEYLGKEANPPKDITAWALDRDPTNPALLSLEVRVLVNKEQLSDLITAIQQVTEALNNAKSTQMQFFEALQGVASQTMKNPEAINQSSRLVDTGLLPAFIQSLPYKSEILSLNDEMYASMTAEERAGLERGLRAKLQQYRDINEQVDGWVRLNQSDSESKKVYPLQIDYLP
jgi:serine/threonine-protein kinase PpkA